MKLSKILFMLVAMAACNTAAAYGSEEKEVLCKKPRFTDFNLTPYTAENKAEVAPEAEFIIKTPATVNPETIKLTAKGEPLPFKLDSNSTFHKITANLPAALTGQFVRLNVSAVAFLGCDEQAGWLVKIAQPTAQQ
jgi:hypothetical protein